MYLILSRTDTYNNNMLYMWNVDHVDEVYDFFSPSCRSSDSVFLWTSRRFRLLYFLRLNTFPALLNYYKLKSVEKFPNMFFTLLLPHRYSL